MNDCVAGEDQISPLAIPRCERCRVKNFAIGGRTSDGTFVHAYAADNEAKLALSGSIGKLAWCGSSARDHFLKLIRIICTSVTVAAPDGDVKLNLCGRCARKVVAQRPRETEERAA
jgi:hypothetical protein